MILKDKTYFLKSNEKLFIASLDEFSKFPFDAASLNSIIKVSDFNKGSFYYRFTDKFDLYMTLVEDAISTQYDIMDGLLKEVNDPRSLYNQIVLLFLSQYSLNRDFPSYASLLHRFSEEESILQSKILSSIRRPLIDESISAIESEIKSSTINVPNIQLFLKLIKSTYYQIPSIISTSTDTDSIRKLVDFLFNGLSNPLLDMKNVLLNSNNIQHKYHRSNFLLNEISFSIYNGEVLSFVGPKGCGKTTLYNILLGNLKQKGGTISTQSDSLSLLSPNNYELAQYIKNSPVIQRKSCGQNILFYAKMYKTNLNMDDLLKRAGLLDVRDVKASKLSKSHYTMLSIACCVATGSKILIFDDVFPNLSDNDYILFKNMLLTLRSQGNSVVMMHSTMKEALDVSDRVGLLVSGNLHSLQKTSDLINKYKSTNHRVVYLEGGIEKIKLLTTEELNNDPFKSLQNQLQIVSINTISQMPDELFKFETGVSLT